jgi:uncharacterized Zn finger protein
MSSRTPQDGQAWSRRWRSWQRSLGLADEGRSSAQVKRLEVLPGRVVATVQERGAPPCEVAIAFRLWRDEEWQRVIDALSSQALYAAQLLAGDLPPDMDRALAAAGVQLLPQHVDEIEQSCSCHADSRRPCEHLAAVYRNLGDLLAEDPWLLFRMRGRDQQGLLRGLRAHRSRENGGTTSGGALGAARRAGTDAGFYRAAGAGSPLGAGAEDIPALTDQIEGFWGSAKAQADFRPQIVPPAVELALLRRLGPPPIGGPDGDIYDDLAALYRRISQTAFTVAYAADPDPTEEDGK